MSYISLETLQFFLEKSDEALIEIIHQYRESKAPEISSLYEDLIREELKLRRELQDTPIIF